MQDLQLASAEPGGEHLVLADPQGTRYRVVVDDALRTAVRRAHAPARPEDAAGPSVAPREVQAIIRAGATPEEAAERTGWTVDRVLLFSGPILAEREHIALRARASTVRLRGRGGEAPTLESRVVERLGERGVDPQTAGWDASRPTGGQEWRVRLTFVAGGRERLATWTYDLGDQILHADDDEARWLSEDETEAAPSGSAVSATYLNGPLEDEAPARGPRRRGPARSAAAAEPTPTEPAADDEEPGAGTGEEEQATDRSRSERPDLISAMRERSKARGRRGRRRSSAETQTPPPAEPLVNDELPFEDAGAPADTAPPQDTEPVEEIDETDDVPFGWRELTADAPDADLPEDEFEDVAQTSDEDIEDVEDPPVDTDEPAEEAPSLQDEAQDEAPAADPEGQAAPEAPAADADADAEEPEQPEDPEPTEPESEPEQPKGRTTRSRKGRTSVPSWDDIMFGGRP